MGSTEIKARNNSHNKKKHDASIPCPEEMNQICVDIGDRVPFLAFSSSGRGMRSEIRFQEKEQKVNKYIGQNSV